MTESYQTIEKCGKAEYTDRKSVFLGFSRPVSTEEEATGFVSEIRRAYPDANHHVYAYVLRENQTARYSDDREPQGTAGMPTLDVIRKSGVVDVCLVVVRYFGGTLLGTGGLVKAYTEAAAGALRDGGIVTFSSYTDLSLETDYADYQKLLPLLSKTSFSEEKTEFREKVTVFGSVRTGDADAFRKAVDDAVGGRAKLALLSERLGYRK